MENNKIIRRHGILKSNLYNTLAEDMCEAFSSFQGVSHRTVQNTNGGSDEYYTLITFDPDEKMYIRIDPDSGKGAVISVHLGNGSTQGTDYLTLDTAGNLASSKGAYSCARTPYGVVFSVVSLSDSNEDSISDAQLRLFFTTFVDEESNEHYGLVYSDKSGLDSIVNLSLYLATPLHTHMERFTGSSLYLGSLANHNVLCNAFSYSQPIVASRLYKKLQSEGDVFGKVKIGGKTLIAGSMYALECIEN